MDDLLKFLKLSILHAGHAKLDEKWNFKNVISPFVRLFLVTHGEAIANYKNKTFTLKSGYMYLIPSFTYNSYYCQKYHEQYYAGFFEELKLGMSIFNIKQFKYEVKATEYDHQLFKRLVQINPNKSVLISNPETHINSSLPNYNSNENTALNYDIETQGILAILLSKFIKNKDVVANQGYFKGDLNRVLIYIAKHLNEQIVIADLAKMCHLSADHFTRSFRAKFGITPNKYIQLKRIERAQFLLLTTRNPPKQIAQQVGMSNMSYFSRKFKSIVGTSPAKFRKQQLTTQ